MSGTDGTTAGPSPRAEADGQQQQQQLADSRPGEDPPALQAPPHLALAVEAASPVSSVAHPYPAGATHAQQQQQQAQQYILRYEYSNNSSRLGFLTLLFVTLCSLVATGAEGIEGYRALRVNENQHDVMVTSRWGLGYRGGRGLGCRG